MATKPHQTIDQRNGIYIGTSKEAVAEARATIMAILGSNCDQETKRAALGSLTSLCSINGATISGCTVNLKSAQPTRAD